MIETGKGSKNWKFKARSGGGLEIVHDIGGVVGRAPAGPPPARGRSPRWTAGAELKTLVEAVMQASPLGGCADMAPMRAKANLSIQGRMAIAPISKGQVWKL